MNWPELVLNAVFEEPGPIVFKYTRRLGCEGIVSKRRGSRLRRPSNISNTNIRMPKSLCTIW